MSSSSDLKTRTRISITVDNEKHKWIKAYCEKTGYKKSRVFEVALNAFLNENYISFDEFKEKEDHTDGKQKENWC